MESELSQDFINKAFNELNTELYTEQYTEQYVEKHTNQYGGKYNKKDDQDLFKKYCKNSNYQPPIMDPVRRIIAIGDIHGNMRFAIDCLRTAKLIKIKLKYNGFPYLDRNDEVINVEWIGGDTVVVQVGDQIDSCRPYPHDCNHPDAVVLDEASDIPILKFFTKLDKMARKKGGKVISLLGNHELMNVMGNMNYVSIANKKYFDPKHGNQALGTKERVEQFKPGNKYAKYLACNRLSSVIIGDFIFVHAGIINQFLKNNNINSKDPKKNKDDLAEINLNVRKWLLKLVDTDYVNKIVSSTPSSMFWDRILGTIPNNTNENDDVCIKNLNPVLKTFDANGIIIGHTPQFHANKSGISKACGKKVLRVDVGGSHAFNYFDRIYSEQGVVTDLRRAQVLEIITDLNDPDHKPTMTVLKMKLDETIEKVPL